MSLVLSGHIIKEPIDWIKDKCEIQAFKYLIGTHIIKNGTKYPCNIFLSIYFTLKGKRMIPRNYETKGDDSQIERFNSIVHGNNKSHPIWKAFEEIKHNKLLLKE